MTWRRNPLLFRRRHFVAAGISSLFVVLPAFCQQSGIQSSFLPAIIRIPAIAGFVPDVAETEHLPYLTEVTKENQGASVFHPTTSDVLIQQAEEKFRSGSKFYVTSDFDHARSEFDGAIALMLRASDSPTNRSLFEHTLEDMVDAINRFDLTGMGAAQTDDVPGFDKAPIDDILQMTFPVDPAIKDKVVTQLKTTSSVLPLTVNDAVLGYVNYFSGRGHKTIENGLIRAGKYDAMITKIFAEEGIPPELIRLAQAESGFMPRAVSVAAAKGMWQFVKFRGNEYGLMQTPWTDDRLDPEKATRAAAHHLHDLFNEFHDWYLAMASYNCGPGVIEKAVERTGYADFWELRARKVIPAETANYVPIILAMTIVSKNAAEYGIYDITPERPIEYETLKLDAAVNLGLISDLTETPIPELQQLNPALLRGTAPEGYDLHVPKGMAADVQAGLMAVPAANRATARVHKVEPGENLAAIATRYKSTPALLASANGLEKGGDLTSGNRLVIPAGYHEAAPKPVLAAATSNKAKNGRRTVATAKTHAAAASGPVARTVSGPVVRTASGPVAKTLAKKAASKPATLVRAVRPASAALVR
jgi:membrane-bound lytic murein transglycosylase D